MSDNVTEKPESDKGKIIGGGVAAVIGAIVAYGLIGNYAGVPGVFAAAIVFGLIGAAIGAAFD